MRPGNPNELIIGISILSYLLVVSSLLCLGVRPAPFFCTAKSLTWAFRFLVVWLVVARCSQIVLMLLSIKYHLVSAGSPNPISRGRYTLLESLMRLQFVSGDRSHDLWQHERFPPYLCDLVSIPTNHPDFRCCKSLEMVQVISYSHRY